MPEYYLLEKTTFPEWELFNEFLDTPEDIQIKLEFYNKMKISCKKWNFKEQLIDATSSECLILLQSCLKFVENAFMFQEKFLKKY